RIFCGNRSRCPTRRSVKANETVESAYRSATSCTFHVPSAGTLWKITSTARKSTNEIRNAPVRSRANDTRYCSCERTWAPTSRRQRKTLATALHHQPARAGAQREPPEREQRRRPEDLQAEEEHQLDALVLAEPEVDRRLEDRGEGQRLRRRAQPAGEEWHRD